MIIYHIEEKSLGEWNDVCLPTEHKRLAWDICHMQARKKHGMVRVATYDDRDPAPTVVALVSDTGWMPSAWHLLPR